MIRVLHVEDDVDHHELIRMWLVQAGHAVDHARTIDQAVDRIADSDIVLLDWELGDESGDALLGHDTVRTSDIPVVVISGHDVDQVDAAAFEHGAAAFLTKSELNQGLVDRTVRYAVRVTKREQPKPFDAKDTKLAIALARGSKVADAAEDAGVAVRTAYRRIADPDFQAYVTSLKARVAETLIERTLRDL